MIIQIETPERYVTIVESRLRCKYEYIDKNGFIVGDPYIYPITVWGL